MDKCPNLGCGLTLGEAWLYECGCDWSEGTRPKIVDPDHMHCPLRCEHPQPFMRGDQAFCGRCWFVNRVMTEMVPCAPPYCDELNTPDQWHIREPAVSEDPNAAVSRCHSARTDLPAPSAGSTPDTPAGVPS